MTKIQTRHQNDAIDFLQLLNDAPDGAEKTVDSHTVVSIKEVLRNRGYVEVSGRGLAANWTITKAGRDFLAASKEEAAAA